MLTFEDIDAWLNENKITFVNADSGEFCSRIFQAAYETGSFEVAITAVGDNRFRVALLNAVSITAEQTQDAELLLDINKSCHAYDCTWYLSSANEFHYHVIIAGLVFPHSMDDIVQFIHTVGRVALNVSSIAETNIAQMLDNADDVVIQ